VALVFAVSRVRNEEDVIVPWARHLLAECDGLVVADNLSTDRTRLLLAQIAEEDPLLLLTDEPEMAYWQNRTMDRLAAVAAEMGAEWIVPCDADEWWYCPDGRRIADALANDPREAVAANMWTMVPQASDDPSEVDPFRRIVWRHRTHTSFPKVAYRWAPGRHIGMGNHGVAGLSARADGTLEIRHVPYRTRDQARAKVIHGRTALEATDMTVNIGDEWRALGALDDEGFDGWWANFTDCHDCILMGPP
jgi:Glycosyl transferase family 2